VLMRQKLLERSGPGALLVSDDWWGARMDWPVPEAPRRRPQSCLSGQLLRLDQVFLLEYYILYKAHWMPHVEVRVAANVPPPHPPRQAAPGSAWDARAPDHIDGTGMPDYDGHCRREGGIP